MRPILAGGLRATPVVFADVLEPVEHDGVDDRGVLALVPVAAVRDLAEVQPVLQHDVDDGVGERPLALVALPPRRVALLPVALRVEVAGDLADRPELGHLLERLADDDRLGLVDGEVTAAVSVVAERRGAAVPEATLSPRLHGDAGAVGGLLAFEFGEDQHELEHRPADRLRGVEGLVERDELDVPSLEGPVQLVEVEERAGEAVQPGDHDHVDLAGADGGEHLLELGAVEVLAAGAFFAEDAGDKVRGLARGDGGTEAGLLGLQGALVAELVVGGDAGVEGDAEGVGGRGGGRTGRGCHWGTYEAARAENCWIRVAKAGSRSSSGVVMRTPWAARS
ncbi:MAG: hypothetical protein Q8P18_12230 [Pseudomonadota bacterium]|nr:hypothetical protein [Pseudomonadota bacterium]